MTGRPMDQVEQARAEFGGAQFGDARLNSRVLAVGAAVASKPEQSLPTIMGGDAELEATYRWLSNSKVTAERVLQPHIERTCERAQCGERVLAIFDTTEVRLGGERTQLGYLAQKGRGFQAHIGLAVNARTRDPLGVLHCESMFRRGKPKKRNSSKGAADSEIWRWHRGVEAVHSLLPQAICVMDRESDVYSLLHGMQQRGQSFVVRAAYNRNTSEGPLWDLLDGAPVFSTRNAEVSERWHANQRNSKRRSHPEHSAHTATLEVRSRQVRLRDPATSSHEQAVRQDRWLEAHLVHVVEPQPPEGDEPVEWLLLTNLPASNEADVSFVVDAYRTRWVIEEYFKVLKTNCSLEKRQLETERSMTNMLAVTLPIGWIVLRLRQLSRQCPEQPATNLLSPTMLMCLRLLYSKRRRRELPESPTCRELTWAVAGLGGHITNNGEPGVIVLARGMADLIMATDVVQALKNAGKM